tara:strand:+ start:887 stop:1018 length:132 start_codon:yes stop_codon:yes gene_type:complete
MTALEDLMRVRDFEIDALRRERKELLKTIERLTKENEELKLKL